MWPKIIVVAIVALLLFYAVVTTIFRLRFDGHSTATQLLIKGHCGRSDVIR